MKNTTAKGNGPVRFFDSNAMFGPCYSPRQERYYPVEDLLFDMDLYGIERAVVYYGPAYHYNALAGNRELAEILSGQQRLKASWILGPHQAGQYPPPGELVPELLASGAVSARFFWGGLLSNDSFPDLDTYGKLWEELEDRRIPSIVNFDASLAVAGLQISQLGLMLENFPRLPVIFSFPKQDRDWAILYDKMERFPNLHLDSCGLMTDYIIEDIVQRFGAGRILFGSNFPWFNAGQCRIALSYAEISDADKRMIAGGNLERLIGGIKP